MTVLISDAKVPKISDFINNNNNYYIKLGLVIQSCNWKLELDRISLAYLIISSLKLSETQVHNKWVKLGWIVVGTWWNVTWSNVFRAVIRFWLVSLRLFQWMKKDWGYVKSQPREEGIQSRKYLAYSKSLKLTYASFMNTIMQYMMNIHLCAYVHVAYVYDLLPF